MDASSSVRMRLRENGDTTGFRCRRMMSAPGRHATAAVPAASRPSSPGRHWNVTTAHTEGQRSLRRKSHRERIRLRRRVSNGTADRMARSLASVINLLDPDVIVLGGGLSNIAALYTAVPQRWARYVFSDRVDTRLVRARHGDSSGVRGAAWLWDE